MADDKKQEKEDIFAKVHAKPANENFLAEKSKHAPTEEAKQEQRLESQMPGEIGDRQPEEVRASQPLLPEDRKELSKESEELSE